MLFFCSKEEKSLDNVLNCCSTVKLTNALLQWVCTDVTSFNNGNGGCSTLGGLEFEDTGSARSELSSEYSKTGVGGKLVHVVACDDESIISDSAIHDTLEATGVDAADDDVVGESSFMKCCSATAGEANCFASLVVTFVLHDAPMKYKTNKSNCVYIYYVCEILTSATVVGFQLLLNKYTSLIPKFAVLVCNPRFTISI